MFRCPYLPVIRTANNTHPRGPRRPTVSDVRVRAPPSDRRRAPLQRGRPTPLFAPRPCPPLLWPQQQTFLPRRCWRRRFTYMGSSLQTIRVGVASVVLGWPPAAAATDHRHLGSWWKRCGGPFVIFFIAFLFYSIPCLQIPRGCLNDDRLADLASVVRNCCL